MLVAKKAFYASHAVPPCERNDALTLNKHFLYSFITSYRKRGLKNLWG